MAKTVSFILLLIILMIAGCTHQAIPATEPAETPTQSASSIDQSQSTSQPAPPEFKVVSLTLTPTLAEPRQAVTVGAEVMNVGEIEGTYTAILTVDGVDVETKEIIVAAGARETITFSLVKDTPGTYRISVNGTMDTLKVLKPAEFKVTYMAITPCIVEPGEVVTVEVKVINTGEMEGFHNLTLSVDGVEEETERVTIDPNTSKTVMFNITRETPGSYDIRVKELSGNLKVERPETQPSSVSESTPQEDIERYRKGNATLTIVDSDGEPRSGKTVTYQQTSHSFLFGINFNGLWHASLSVLEQFNSIGINYLTPRFPWLNIEPQRGQFDWSWVEESFAPSELHKRGFNLMGVWLVWFYALYNNTPDYLLFMSFDEVKQSIYDHSHTVVNHYKDIIDYWQLNEPTIPWPRANTLGFNNDQWVEVCRVLAEAVKEADSEAQVQINFGCPGGLVSMAYFPQDFASRLVRENISFDIIGLQFYPTSSQCDGNGYPELNWVSEMLDSYGMLGKTVWIQEVAIPDVPSPEAQAEWIRSFYTLAFSKPYVQGIRWLCAIDDSIYPQNDGKLAGLLTTEFTPKPAYYALKDIIQNWTTSSQGLTDEQGNITFSGFGGYYNITITDTKGGTSLEREIKVDEQKHNLFIIVLD